MFPLWEKMMKKNLTMIPAILAVVIVGILCSCGEGPSDQQEGLLVSSDRPGHDQQEAQPMASRGTEVTFYVGGLMKTESGAT